MARVVHDALGAVLTADVSQPNRQALTRSIFVVAGSGVAPGRYWSPFAGYVNNPDTINVSGGPLNLSVGCRDPAKSSG